MAKAKPAGGGSNTAAQMRSKLERAERLIEERKTINDDIKDIWRECKSEGFDVKALKKILKDRASDAEAVFEFETIVDTYRAALGMLPDDSDPDPEDEPV